MPGAFHLFDHLVSTHEECRRNSEPQSSCRLQVYDEVKFCRLLNRKAGRRCAFENLVDMVRRFAAQLPLVRPISDQSAGQKQTLAARALLDHLFCAPEQRRGDAQAQCFRGLEIYDQLHFANLLHRQIGRLLSL